MYEFEVLLYIMILKQMKDVPAMHLSLTIFLRNFVILLRNKYIVIWP